MIKKWIRWLGWCYVAAWLLILTHTVVFDIEPKVEYAELGVRMNQAHIQGLFKNNERLYDHILRLEGRCPSCHDLRLNRKRNSQKSVPNTL
jgi:hypothetical protein